MKTIKNTWRFIARSLAVITCFLCLSLQVQAFQDETAPTKTGKTPITQRDYNNTEIEMADEWRANGKIYVVIATLSALLGGIALYLVMLDRRIGKLEKELKE